MKISDNLLSDYNNMRGRDNLQEARTSKTPSSDAGKL
jgi:hypothetical protein